MDRHAVDTIEIPESQIRMDGLAARVARWAAVAAVVGIAGSLALSLSREGGLDRWLSSYLVSFAFLLSLCLGGLFFVMLQHVTRAGWSVVVRRIAEGVAANVDLMAVLAIPVVLGLGRLYHWAHTDAVATDPLLSGKAGYLNPPFFVVRLALYFAIWILLSRLLLSRSTAQDGSGEPQLTIRMEKISAPGLVLFALSTNFAAFDLLMSLDPHWFSTIFGVYYFSAGVVGFFAALAILLYWLQRRGRLVNVVSSEHYHEVGKLMFAFTVFWAYIAFSQYLLIWYGNIPEETEWFLKRQTGDWAWVSVALLFGHFLLPFLALISRPPKRHPAALAAIAVWVVAACWLDIYWLVVPEFSPGVARFGAIDVLCFLGLAGTWTAVLAWRLGRRELVPRSDPRLGESLAFESA